MKKRVSNYLKTLITFCLLLIATMGKAQNIGINVTGATPNAKAMLDIDATGMATKGGLLIPRLTTAERNAITAPIPMSLLIYNTTTNCFEAWNQTANSWIAFGCITCATPTTPAATAATANTSSSFIANWAAVTGATNYFLDVSTNASFSSFVSGYNNINIGNSTAAGITNLTCNTTYYYRVRAANTCTSSVSANSNTITVTTSGCGGGSGPSNSELAWCGTQGIMKKNLNVGTMISNSVQSNNGIIEKFCYLNDSILCEQYGGMYIWREAMAYNSGVNCDPCGSSGVQGICPTGFHIPTNQEMARYAHCLESTMDPIDTVSLATFQLYQGSNIPVPNTNVGLKMGYRYSDIALGPVDPFIINSTNISKFSALLSGTTGQIFPQSASFWLTQYFYMHTASENGPSLGGVLVLGSAVGNSIQIGFDNKDTFGAAIRCMKD